MSYASSTKGFPNLLKSIPQKLIQPTGIAVLASVGIHVVLGASLPYWSHSSQGKPKPVRNVQLMELSQNDLSRLPPPPLPLQPLPPNINQQIQPLSPSIPSSLTSSLPSIPSSLPSQKSSVGNEPSIGITDIPPLSFDLPSSLGQSRRQNPDLRKLGIMDSPLRPDLELQRTQSPPPPKGASALQSPSGKPKNSLPSGTMSSSGRERELARWLSGISAAPVYEPPLPGTTNSSQSAGLLQPPPQTPPIASYLPGPPPLVPKNDFTPAPISPSTQTAQAPVSEQGTLAVNSSDPNSQALIQDLREWSQQNQRDNRPETIKISRNYPSNNAAAGESKDGFVVVTVKVDESGRVISNSLEVRGSSFSDGSLDAEAMSTVRGYSFPSKGKEQAYVVQVQFKNGGGVVERSTESPTSTQKPSTPNPEVSPARPSNSKPEATIDRPSTPKPESSLDRPGTLKPPVIINTPSTPKPPVINENLSTPKPEATIDRPSTPKPQVSPERSNSLKPEATSDRPSIPKPEATSSPASAPKPEASPTRSSAPKPEATSSPASAPKPEASPARSSAPKPEVTSSPASAPKPEAPPARSSAPKPEVTSSPASTPKPEAPPARSSTPKPEAANDRPSNPKPEANSDRISAPKPEGSLKPPSAPKPEGKLKPPSVPTP